MLNSSYTLGRIFGIPIKLDVSLIILAALMWFDYGIFYGSLFAMSLLASIILHELGHSLVSMQFGCRVREITLMVLGGRAVLDRMPRRHWQELLVAIAGPAVSFGIVIAMRFGVGLPLSFLGSFAGTSRMSGLSVLAVLVQYTADLNLVLGVFNLLPAFPMDGGRVLRALLAHPLGLVRATRFAMYVGRVLAIGGGIYALWPPHHDYFLLLIAFFVYTASGQEYRMVLYEASHTGWSGRDDITPEDQIVVSPPPYHRDH